MRENAYIPILGKQNEMVGFVMFGDGVLWTEQADDLDLFVTSSFVGLFPSDDTKGMTLSEGTLCVFSTSFL